MLIDGTQATYCNIYRNADLPLRRAQASIQIIKSTPRYGIEALGMVLIAALAFSFAGRPEGLAAAVPVLGALALGAGRLLPVLQQAYSSWTAMRGGQVPLKNALDLLDQPLPNYIEFPGGLDERVGKIGVDAPIADFVGVCQVVAGDGRTNAHVVKLVFLSTQTDFDVSQTFAIGKLGEGHTQILAEAGKLPDLEVAIIASDTLVKDVERKMLHHLGEDNFPGIHRSDLFGMPVEQFDYDRVRQAAQQAEAADQADIPEGMDIPTE